MIEMSLRFSESEKPELIETIFTHPNLGQPRKAVRGRPVNIRLYPYSFQWSPAVRSLVCLLLKGAIASHRCDNSTVASIVGGKSSAALSLDHAISKQPTWLFDMFGADARGNCLIRKILSRRNQGLKRPEPLEITIDTNQLPLKNIKIYQLQNDISDSAERLVALYKTMGFEEYPPTPSVEAPVISHVIPETGGCRGMIRGKASLTRKTEPFMAPFSSGALSTPGEVSSSIFYELLTKELDSSLRSVDAFSREKIKRVSQRLWGDPSFSRVAGRPREFLSSIDLSLSKSLLQGGLRCTDPLDKILRQNKIHVALPAAMVGTLAILLHMREVLGYDLDITYNFPSTGTLLKDMMEDAFSEPPDICGLSIATAAVFLGRSANNEYHPLMITPKTSHRIISPIGKKGFKNLAKGSYLFDTMESSTTSFFFNDLKDSRIISQRKIGIEHMQAHEMWRTLKSGDDDLRAILWFPFDRLNMLLNNCVNVYGDADPRQWKETMLFAHGRFAARQELCTAFDAGVRRAWSDLLESSRARRHIAEFLVRDPLYMRTIYQYTGLIQTPPPPFSEHQIRAVG